MLPDDQTLVLSGSESSRGTGPPHAQRIWLMDRSGSTLRAISPEGVWSIRPRPVAPDGSFVVGVDRLTGTRRVQAYPVAGGEPWPLKLMLTGGELRAGWAPDGRSVFMLSQGALPMRRERVDITTGARTFVSEISPPDPVGRRIAIWSRTTPDGKTYVYSSAFARSELYLVQGLR